MKIAKVNLTVEEAIEASGIGRTTMFGLIKRGELESIKIGRRRYVPVAALDDFLSRLRAEQNEATV
ncbi:helix-turn-helix domain-containing protein [Streptomyces sp. UG1]|uniref:helix-turn-helix domain-containing protein n=1 Tax=Streptomyces sp. UG1 TaxID=3417652 RepID=UPI003CEAA9F4